MNAYIRISALVLVGISAAIGAIAIGSIGYGLVAGAIGQGETGIFIGVTLLFLAGAHALVGGGMWRHFSWAPRLAAAIAVVGVGAAVITAIGSLNTGSSVAGADGRLRPWVDARGLTLAVAGGLGYAFVLVSVLVELVKSTRGKPNASAR